MDLFNGGTDHKFLGLIISAITYKSILTPLLVIEKFTPNIAQVSLSNNKSITKYFLGNLLYENYE